MMAAVVQFHHQKKQPRIYYYSKWILILGIIILTVLAIFQFNLPPPSSSSVTDQIITELNQHKDKHLQHHHHHDYDIFTSSFQTGFTFASQVPRVILNSKVRYVINNPVCAENGEVFMLILVTSHAGDVDMRRKIREILPQEQLEEVKIQRLFLLALPPGHNQHQDAKYKDVSMKQISDENEQFHDILMGDFTESYKSLTFKHLMGLDWAASFCPNAKFVLKQDDDTIVDYYQLRELLQRETHPGGGKHFNPQGLWIYGKILDKQPVERDHESKWFVSVNEYRHANYPAYVSGWAYVTTIPAIQDLMKASSVFNYLFVDDAFVTGIIREKTQVSLMDMGDYFTPSKGHLMCCVYVPIFAKSKNNEPFWCDYLVGPSNDDLELMGIYQRHSQYCFVSKQCRRREHSELLIKKCVITGDMKFQDFSQLHGKGTPKPVIRKQ